MVETKPYSEEDLKAFCDIVGVITNGTVNCSPARFLTTIDRLKAENARLIKAIEPLMDEIPSFVIAMPEGDDAEVQLTVTVGELRNLVAAKEGADGTH